MIVAAEQKAVLVLSPRDNGVLEPPHAQNAPRMRKAALLLQTVAQLKAFFNG
jgi:hypothetical protein